MKVLKFAIQPPSVTANGACWPRLSSGRRPKWPARARARARKGGEMGEEPAGNWTLALDWKWKWKWTREVEVSPRDHM